ncbi:MAG: enoyl-CoA hydratase/isomerase family protein [Pseudomonadota bacterium]
MASVVLSQNRKTSTVALNRPEKLNAINSELLDELHGALTQAHADPSALIVLKGNGEAFSAGDDLEELAQKPPSLEEARAFARTLQDITRLICFGPKHVICATHGWVIGGAIAWPLNADFSIWSDNTRLFSPEASYGMFVSGGVSHLLPERCGRENADRIMLLGQKLSINDLQALGVAQNVVPAADLDDAVSKLADHLLGLPPSSLHRYKSVSVERLRAPLEQALKAEEKALVSCAEQAGVVSERITSFSSRS